QSKVSIIADNAGILYAAGYYGIYRSTDHGRDWQLTKFPQHRYAYVETLVADSSGNVTVSTPYAVFRSSDRGIAWQFADSLDYDISFRLIRSLPSGELLAFGRNESLLIFHSSDGGAHWDSVRAASDTPARFSDICANSKGILFLTAD